MTAELYKILSRLERIEKMINGSNGTLRLTRNEAKKFLVIGEDKLRTLEIKGLIKRRTDLFGQVYYMKDELTKLLKEGMTDPAIKSQLRRVS